MRQYENMQIGLHKVSNGIGLVGVLLLAMMVVGCQKGSAGRFQQATLAAGAPEGTKPSIVGGIELSLDGGGTYKMNGFPATEGSWKEEGEEITLTPKDGKGEKYVLRKKSADEYEQVEPKRSVPTFWIRVPKT
ncbi:MAG: hypothetical protein KF812_02460 [Fimbriimonadaceae bacterium]|nr:hypothetical protein [Fimbriimonadaceae bacterium]